MNMVHFKNKALHRHYILCAMYIVHIYTVVAVSYSVTLGQCHLPDTVTLIMMHVQQNMQDVYCVKLKTGVCPAILSFHMDSSKWFIRWWYNFCNLWQGFSCSASASNYYYYYYYYYYYWGPRWHSVYGAVQQIGRSLVRSQLVSLEFFIDIKSFRSHYGPGVDSASNRNEYQEQGVKAAGV